MYRFCSKTNPCCLKQFKKGKNYYCEPRYSSPDSLNNSKYSKVLLPGPLLNYGSWLHILEKYIFKRIIDLAEFLTLPETNHTTFFPSILGEKEVYSFFRKRIGKNLDLSEKNHIKPIKLIYMFIFSLKSQNILPNTTQFTQWN